LSDAQALPQTRVTQRIDETSLVTLKGNTRRLAQPRFDLGPAPVSMAASRMLLVLKRSAQQQASLETYLSSAQDPASPNYRKWLTPEQFGKRFGVSDADLATIQSWLQGRGFTVNKVAKGRMVIEFSGTVGQIQSAFHTSVHQYKINGAKFWANSADPQIPAALAPVVAGFAELNSFVPKSLAIRGPGGRYDPKTNRIQPTYTVGSTNNGYTIFLGPADAATIYDTPTTLNANLSSSALDGSGVTIGIAGDSNIDVAQNANYRATFGLPAKPTSVVVDGTDPGENGDALEAYLDTEVSGGIAPNANIILYTAANTDLNAGLFLAIGRALDDNQVDILNVSFGGCEFDQGTSGNQYIYDLWEQAAAQGISVTVSTGDSGSAGCDDPNTETIATLGLAVNGLASTPYNIAVGGTDFDTLYSSFPNSFTNYVDVTNTFANHRSALGYIPEEPWNNSTFQGYNTTIAQDVPWDSTQYSAMQNIVAAGGGVSACTTVNGTSCSSGYPVPSWQSRFATDTSGRNLPDVSLLSANGLYGALWGLCTDVDYQGASTPVTDCAGNPTTGNAFNLTGVGGTSASAPAFAGILALVKQKAGTRLGQADYVLYNLAKSNYNTVFHDVSTGNNSVSCTSGTLDCTLNAAGYYFLTGYDTAAGYDEATGLGSVDASQLVSSWANAGLTATTASLTLNGGTAPLNLTHGAQVTVGATVSGVGGTPVGDIALVDSIDPAKFPNNDSLGFFTLASGSVTGTATDLPGGSYSVSAHYGGSEVFSASDSNSISVSVNPETSTTNLTVGGYYDPTTFQLAPTPYYGFIYVLDAQPYGNTASASAPNGSATGTITYLNGASTLGTAVLGSDGVAELQTVSLPAGNLSLTAAFPGDPSFQASTSAAVPLSVSPGITSIGPPVPDPAYLSAGISVTLTATFNPLDSFGLAPTGTVTFVDTTSAATTTLGTVPVKGIAGSLGSNTHAGGTASYTTSLLPSGDNTVTAVYNGDANYQASPVSGPSGVPVNPALPAMTAIPAESSIKVNQALQITVSFAATTGLPLPTGAVYMTAPGTNTPAGYTSPTVTIVNGSASITIPPNSLMLGAITLTANYGGDLYYNANTATAVIQVNSTGTLAPTVTVTPSVSTVHSYPMQVAVKVTGTAGEPVATGTVKLITPNYSFAPLTLANGSATFTLVGGELQVGPNSLPVTYSGDDNYTSGSGSAQVIQAGIPIVIVTPAVSSIIVNQSLSVSIQVEPSSTLPNPTGTITLISGTYTSGPVSLSAGKATIVIPANSLAVGFTNITANYSGDSNYNQTSGLGELTVYGTSPSLSISNGGSINVTAGQLTNNSTNIILTPANGFSGTVNLTAAITSGPSGAVAPPTLSFLQNSVTVGGDTPQTVQLFVSTTAATTAMLAPAGHSNKGRWLSASGAALACVLLLGIPARRRTWRAMLGVFILLVAFAGGIVACGGGGSGSTGGGSSGTTPGTYTITVTGTSGNLTLTTVVNLTVN
jgi:hypothetical protein